MNVGSKAIPDSSVCLKFEKKGYFCSTSPESVVCPFCRKDNDRGDAMLELDEVMFLCQFCKCIFGLGCMHRVGGCDYNEHNAIIITDFLHTPTGNRSDRILFKKRTPIFESVDFFESVKDDYTLKMYCTCNGSSNDCRESTKPKKSTTCNEKDDRLWERIIKTL